MSTDEVYTMADLIQPNPIPGVAVYGVQQYEYTVAGDPAKDYTAALVAATFKESVAIEHSTSAYADVVRQRERKVEDLGLVLSALNQAIATMDPKSNDTGKRSSWLTSLYQAWQVATQYGITLPDISIGTNSSGQPVASITYRGATRAQNDIQYQLDTEDNNLQQDLVSLQSLISKRDNAFSAAAKIVKKSENAASGTIHNMT